MATIERDLVLDLGGGSTLTYDVDDIRGPVNQRFSWAPGTREANRQAQLAKLTQTRASFRNNFQQWGTLTVAQKDAANRQAQRVLANLLAYVLEDMEDAGD